ncbi:MAG: FtsX-like permease family protein, partial [Chitinispirillaceae bacterium]|nr:FtsX-like permease family protein [Chitinispirillaceae bacterium]
NDIRVGTKGIVKYKQLNTIWGGFAIIDIESYRECMGYISAEDKSTLTISEEDEKILRLDGSEIEDYFSEEIIENKVATGKEEKDTIEKGKSIKEIKNIDLDQGTYNMVLVLLKNNWGLKKVAETLEKKLKENGCGVRVIRWDKAVGTIGSMALLIKSALFIFVMFLFFVAVIIIVNTLSMAALERTSEIGMMRAIGASKGFIGNMFMWETAILSFLSGGAGIVLGFLFVNIISLMKISTDNDMLQLLFGGDTFRPFLSVIDILVVIFQLTLVTIVAVLYPVKIARKITPLDAITRE